MKHATITEATLLGDSSLSSAATARGRPLHKILAAFSAAYFAGALITDLVYWQIPDVLWERFSIWLIIGEPTGGRTTQTAGSAARSMDWLASSAISAS